MKDDKFHPVAYNVIRTSGRDASIAKPAPGQSTRNAVTPLDRWLVRRLAWHIGSPPVTLALWNGEKAYSPSAPSAGRITFLDRKGLIGVVLNPELGFGDAYTAGRIDVHGNLVDVLHGAFVAMENSPWNRFRRSVLPHVPRFRRNTRTGSKKNIHYHYDIGNAFYRLWLDEDMVYTCAYFAGADMTLEQAQEAKLDLVCRKLGLRPGMNVAEAGCGWGSLALHMARQHGVTVKAYNISQEQIAYARDRAAAAGLADRVEFIEDDYRNMRGDFDAFVSVGMLEHVGTDNYGVLGSVIDRCLKDEGWGLIHSIGRNRAMPMNAWTDKRIFPGSHAPSLSEMMDVLEPGGFSVLDVENLRLHYAQTLVKWLERFEEKRDQVRMLYDDAFVRGWRLYLASSAAAFLAGNLQLFQVVFARFSNNAIPLTRRHLFRDDEPGHRDFR